MEATCQHAIHDRQVLIEKCPLVGHLATPPHLTFDLRHVPTSASELAAATAAARAATTAAAAAAGGGGEGGETHGGGFTGYSIGRHSPQVIVVDASVISLGN